MSQFNSGTSIVLYVQPLDTHQNLQHEKKHKRYWLQ